jgi:hypothetical protein
MKLTEVQDKRKERSLSPTSCAHMKGKFDTVVLLGDSHENAHYEGDQCGKTLDEADEERLGLEPAAAEWTERMAEAAEMHRDYERGV